jgi:hypothetical protein
MATSLGDFMITKENRAYRKIFFRDHAAWEQRGAGGVTPRRSVPLSGTDWTR